MIQPRAAVGVPGGEAPHALPEQQGAAVHGFALILAMGDRPRALRLATEALDAAAARSHQLSTDGEAGTWLRAWIVQHIGPMPANVSLDDPARRHALELVGVSDVVAAAISTLTVEERAALLAASVEGFSLPEVATVLDCTQTMARRILKRARGRYAEAVLASGVSGQRPHGGSS
jgi:DNA-directed RNA polymerase specialized sigma24 family protein